MDRKQQNNDTGDNILYLGKKPAALRDKGSRIKYGIRITAKTRVRDPALFHM